VGRPLDDPETKFFPSRFFMDSPQSQQEKKLYAGFTCTDIRSESDGVVIEVDYDRCKKVAFAEELGLDEKNAEVDYPLYKLYEILKEKSKIKLTSKDYVFVTWLQPIPPTFHTINQVKYITDVIKKLMKINGNIVATPYIYLYFRKYIESSSKRLYNLYERRWNSLDDVENEAFGKKLELLIKITQNIPIYPSLIIHTITPSVLGQINRIYNDAKSMNSSLINLSNLKDWSKGLFGSNKLAEFVFSLLKEKGRPLPPEAKQEIEETISSVYRIIPDTPPPNVALSILFPILTSKNLGNPKILLFGMTPRDIVYYIALLQFINDGSELKENIYYIPTRSIMRYYKEESGYYKEKEFHDYLRKLKQEDKNKEEVLKAFSTENGVSIPLILLFYEIIKELRVICYGDSDPYECKVLDLALEVYNKIKGRHETDSVKSSSLNLFDLIHAGSKILKNFKIIFGLYASEINEVMYSYIIYMRKGGLSGRTSLWAPEVWISQNLEQHLSSGIWPKTVNLDSNIPLGSAFRIDLGSEITKDEEGILGGRIGDASFWLVNVLYFFIARLYKRKGKKR